MTSTIGRFNGSFQTLSMTELFAQHIAQVQYIDEDRGHIRTSTISALFSGAYASELEDFQKIIDQGFRSFYGEASAETKMDVAPLIEQLQKNLQGLR